jgi:cytidine deaminase
MSDLFEKARAVRLNAHAPYSKFRVGAALRTKTGQEFVAGAIAAMIAAGEKEIAEICIVADSPSPISPCGGCRQKLAEFSNSSTPVHLANLEGILASHNLGDLLPHSFSSDHLRNG